MLSIALNVSDRLAARLDTGLDDFLRIADGDPGFAQNLLLKSLDLLRRTAECPSGPFLQFANCQQCQAFGAIFIHVVLSDDGACGQAQTEFIDSNQRSSGRRRPL
jgi:hypothetical protein